MLILFLNEDFMTPYQFDQLMNLLGRINVNIQNLVDLQFADGLKVNTSEPVEKISEEVKEITEVTIPLVKQEEKPLLLEGLHWENPEIAEVKKRGRKKKNEQA